MKLSSSSILFSVISSYFCTTVSLRSSISFDQNVQKFDDLKNIFQSERTSICRSTVFALITIDSKEVDFDKYFQGSSSPILSADLTISEDEDLNGLFESLASRCKTKIEASFNSKTDLQNIQDPLFYDAAFSVFENSLKQMKPGESKFQYLFVFKKSQASSGKTTNGEILESAQKDKNPSKHPGKIILYDPFFWWLSNELILSLLVSLLLLSILFVGISWLASIEGPTRVIDIQTKKQN